MNFRNIIEALLVCVTFVAIAVLYAIEVGHWWAGPLILLTGFSLFALLWTVIWITMGDD